MSKIEDKSQAGHHTQTSAPVSPKLRELVRARLEGRAAEVDSKHPWHNDMPLEDAHNAHKTNTKEEFEEALKGNFQWLEGDIRPEIDHPEKLEMRHDKDHEKGDNLTFDEWLQQGLKTGRGLKLDLTKIDFNKEPERFDQVMEQLEKNHVPGDRLMFNMSMGDISKYGEEIWSKYPDAILAINPPGGDLLSTGKSMTELAQKLRDHTGNADGQVTFILNEGRLALDGDNQPRDGQKIRDFVTQLKKEGSVSIWNDPNAEYSKQGTPASREEQLRDWGVDGIVDLRPPNQPKSESHWWEFWE